MKKLTGIILSALALNFIVPTYATEDHDPINKEEKTSSQRLPPDESDRDNAASAVSKEENEEIGFQVPDTPPFLDEEGGSLAAMLPALQSDELAVQDERPQGWGWPTGFGNYIANSLKSLMRNEDDEKANFPDIMIEHLQALLRSQYDDIPNKYGNATWQDLSKLIFSYQTPTYPGGALIVIGCDYGQVTGSEKDAKREKYRFSELYKYNINVGSFVFNTGGIPKLYEYLEHERADFKGVKFKKLGIKYARTEHTLTGMEYIYLSQDKYLLLACYRTQAPVEEKLINDLRKLFLIRMTIY